MFCSQFYFFFVAVYEYLVKVQRDLFEQLVELDVVEWALIFQQF